MGALTTPPVSTRPDTSRDGRPDDGAHLAPPPAWLRTAHPRSRVGGARRLVPPTSATRRGPLGSQASRCAAGPSWRRGACGASIAGRAQRTRARWLGTAPSHLAPPRGGRLERARRDDRTSGAALRLPESLRRAYAGCAAPHPPRLRAGELSATWSDAESHPACPFATRVTGRVVVIAPPKDRTRAHRALHLTPNWLNRRSRCPTARRQRAPVGLQSVRRPHGRSGAALAESREARPCPSGRRVP